MRALRVSLVLLAIPALAAAAPRPKLAFLGLHAQAGVDPADVRSLSEYTQTELAALGAYDVVGMGDIDSLLGLERTKELLGCDEDASCIADVGGALGVDRALTGNVSKVGGSVLVNFSLLDVRKSRVVGRVGRRVNARDGLEPVLDAVRPAVEELAQADGVKPAKSLEISVLLRGEADVANGGRALSGTAILQGDALGLQATVVGPPVGLRVEGRLAPWILGPARPYLTAGGLVFSDTLGARASGGVELRFGRLRLAADLAFEHYLSADVADAVLLAAGAGAAF